MGRAQRRAYSAVGVMAVDGGYGLSLDDRPLRTPAGAPLVVASRTLAELLAEEWRVQGERIDPAAMSVTGLVNAAIDRVGAHRAEVIGNLMGYCETDLLCYRAEEPDELARRQEEEWQPLLDWAADRFGAPLNVTSGVMAVAQPDPALAALRCAVEALDDLALAALHMATSAIGSLVVGLALRDGRVDGEHAAAIAFLDEDFQAERWGVDPMSTRRTAVLKREIAAAERVFACLAG